MFKKNVIKKKLLIFSLLFFLFINILPLTKNVSADITIILVNNSDDYIKYGFKDVGLYYTPNELTNFNLPLIISKNVNLKKTDLSYRIDKNSENFTKRFISLNYEIINETNDYYLINYNMKCKASNETFNIDIIPKIKDKEYKQFSWWNSNWNYYKVLNVDTTQIRDNQKNFPVPVIVNSTIGAKTDNGNSIRFVDSDNSSEYYYQFEGSFNTTGNTIIWVNITTLNATGCSFNMYYNNSGASDKQNTATWNSSYYAVYHMNTTTDSSVFDSTSNKYSGWLNGNTKITNGIIGDGFYFDGSGDYISLPSGCYQSDVPFCVFGFMYMTDADVREGNTLMRCNDIDSSDLLSLCEYGQANDFFDSIGLRAGGVQFDMYDISSKGCSNFWLNYGLSLYLNYAYHWVNATKGAVDTSCNYMTSTFSKFYIGCSTDGITRNMLGIIDEVRLSNNQRDWNYINTEYNSIRNYTTFCVFGAEVSKPTGAINYQPFFSNFNFTNNTHYYPCDIWQFSIYINDSEGDIITFIFSCNNGDSVSGSGLNTTIYLNLTKYFIPNTTYIIYINLTDPTNNNKGYYNLYTHNYFSDFLTSSIDTSDYLQISGFSLDNSTIGILIFLFLWYYAEKKQDVVYSLLLSALALPFGLYLLYNQISMFDIFLGLGVMLIGVYSSYLSIMFSFRRKRKD